MAFPLNMFVASILSAIHLLISFSLRFTQPFQNRFRRYVVLINLIYLVFLAGFSFFLQANIANQGIMIFLNGLMTLYLLLFIPLGFAVILFLSQSLMRADIRPQLLKYILMLFMSAGIIGLILLGYPAFIFTFYGFAP